MNSECFFVVIVAIVDLFFACLSLLVVVVCLFIRAFVRSFVCLFAGWMVGWLFLVFVCLSWCVRFLFVVCVLFFSFVFVSFWLFSQLCHPIPGDDLVFGGLQ